MNTDWKKEAIEVDDTDSREKLEADVRKVLQSAYMYAWMHGYENMRGCSFENLHREFYNLLDRQAAITKAECDRPNWEYCETCERLAELQAKLDVYNETHILLPLDADGVPIRAGDWLVGVGRWDGERFCVGAIEYDGAKWSVCDAETCDTTNPAQTSHVKPRTIEDVLREIVVLARCLSTDKLDDGDIDKYAAEIRELLVVDE